MSLSEEDWELVTDIELRVMVDQGDGYLSLGSDDWYEFDEDGDLKVEFDYTWVSLNGVIVSYYIAENGEYTDGSSYSIGYVPAILNQEWNILIWLIWDEDGDEIECVYEFYSYEGDFDGEYCLDDNTIYYSEQDDFTVSYDDIGDWDTEIYFYLRDIYQNEYYTESVCYY